MINNEFLGTEKVGKLLFSLAIPTITAQLINVLYNIVDRMYISRIKDVGTIALTGVGVSIPVILIISAFAALITSGATPKASIAMGQKDNDKAEKILGNSFILLIFISCIITTTLLLFKDNILILFGASESALPYASDYIGIYAIGTIFVQLTLGLNAFITSQGFTKVSMRTIMIGAIANIILDPIFIFSFNLGVKGAALATIISQALSCIYVLKFLTGNKTVLKLKKENLKLDLKLILPCVALGVAPFIMQSTESAVILSFNTSLYNFGGDIAVASMTILTSAMQFSMLPLLGLLQGSQPIISYNYGAKNSQRVRQCFRYLLSSAMIYSFTYWLFVMLFPDIFSKIFTPDINLVNYTISPLRVYMSATCIIGIQMACQMTLVSLGYATSSIFLAILRKIILLIPLIYILPHLISNKVMAVFIAEPIADVLAVITTATIFLIQYKKANKFMDNKSKA